MNILPSFLCFAIILNFVVGQLTVRIPPGEKSCFSNFVKKDIYASFLFRVLDGPFKEIDATIVDQTNSLEVYRYPRGYAGQHTVVPNNDIILSFCFDNGLSKYSPKWVQFVYDHDPNVLHPHGTFDDLDPIEVEIRSFHEQIFKLRDVQNELHLSEQGHRSTLEETAERILYWNLFECCVLVTMGIMQMYCLKRFLEIRASV